MSLASAALPERTQRDGEVDPMEAAQVPTLYKGLAALALVLTWQSQMSMAALLQLSLVPDRFPLCIPSLFTYCWLDGTMFEALMLAVMLCLAGMSLRNEAAERWSQRDQILYLLAVGVGSGLGTLVFAGMLGAMGGRAALHMVWRGPGPLIQAFLVAAAHDDPWKTTWICCNEVPRTKLPGYVLFARGVMFALAGTGPIEGQRAPAGEEVLEPEALLKHGVAAAEPPYIAGPFVVPDLFAVIIAWAFIRYHHRGGDAEFRLPQLLWPFGVTPPQQLPSARANDSAQRGGQRSGRAGPQPAAHVPMTAVILQAAAARLQAQQGDRQDQSVAV
eukprot:TRINITY_DN40173_c0_g1_i1.p1 TRINITY_DN40173_c0_g1~~TRINITY_DN40173_c0_g1_i1.p1  ORF type:complete len:342 (+),score=82.90 TRINITY_DN40173_c0_g1_i1:34-1026(+)